jgi:hypothetical protein
MIVRRPRTSHTRPDVYEIYPKRYYDPIPFSRYYARHQKYYAVPVESSWGKKHIGRVESPVKKPRSRNSLLSKSKRRPLWRRKTTICQNRLPILAKESSEMGKRKMRNIVQ